MSLSIKGRAQEAVQPPPALSIKGIAKEPSTPDIPSGSHVSSSTSDAPSDREKDRERKKLVRHTDLARSGALKENGRTEDESSSTGVAEESPAPRDAGPRRRIQIKRPAGPRSEAKSELHDEVMQPTESERRRSGDAAPERQPSSRSPDVRHRRHSSRYDRRSEDRAWAAEGKSRSNSPAKRPSRRERSPDERRDREREKERDQSPERRHERNGQRERRDKSPERSREGHRDRDRGPERERDREEKRRSPERERRGERERDGDKHERSHHRRDSDHRRSSLKEEPKRSREIHSRSHRHRSASASESEDSEEERRRRKRRKDKERRREEEERDERRRSRKEKERRDDDKDREKKKKPSTSVASGSYGKYGVITVTDVPRMNLEFRAWLVEQRRLGPDVISRDKFNKEFAIFVDDFNNVTLPHEKYYNMAHHQARMAAIRNGEAVPKVLDYDPRADEKAHVARLRATHLPDQADLTREEIIELRRLEKERIEVSKRRQLGLEVPKGLGVRTVEVPIESWKDPNLF